MDFLAAAFDYFLHVDRHLLEFATAYGIWIYALLFLIIFFETGVVVTPFLPGDSLLFATGALAAAGVIDVVAVLSLLTAAAILGDNTNYFIGRAVGPRVFKEHSRWLKREHLLRTQEFYAKHGGKTVVLARFVPIVRTFAPFVADVGRMHYPRFLSFDVGGGILWVWSFGLLGYFFGDLPIVKENFGLTIVAVVVLSLLPFAFEAWRARASRARASRARARS
ncbi:MAG TPA: DedA family protein [Gammaproteobacteria bacterium]|nr:DedA family protein [Gammaproteobacteria bacterium]